VQRGGEASLGGTAGQVSSRIVLTSTWPHPSLSLRLTHHCCYTCRTCFELMNSSKFLGGEDHGGATDLHSSSVLAAWSDALAVACETCEAVSRQYRNAKHLPAVISQLRTVLLEAVALISTWVESNSCSSTSSSSSAGRKIITGSPEEGSDVLRCTPSAAVKQFWTEGLVQSHTRLILQVGMCDDASYQKLRPQRQRPEHLLY
jgi:hypothetical protein